MKQISLLLFTSFVFLFSYAQDPTEAVGTVDTIPAGVDTRSQHEIARLWNDKQYITWYPYSSAYGMMQMGTSQVIKFIKNSEGDVTEIRVGNESVYDTFKPDFRSGTDFVTAYSVNAMSVLYLSEKGIVSYTIEDGYTVKSINWVASKRNSIRGAIKEVQAYLDYGKRKVEADRQARIQARKEHRAKYSLEGKEVVAIEMIFPNGEPKEITLDGVEIGFEATLKDGSKIKTKNCGGEGYIEDFVLDFHNGKSIGIGSGYTPMGYGDYYVSKSMVAGAFTDVSGRDIFSVTVKSRYGGDASVSKEIALVYPTSMNVYHNGETGYTYPGNGKANGGVAGHGSPLTVWVKKVKHTETGEDLYMIKIQDGFTSAVQYIKLSGAASLYVEANGGAGGDGSPGKSKWSSDSGKPESGGNGGQGGNGGDIHLILDPSAKSFTFTYSNKAGAAGGAGRGGNCNSCPYGSEGDRGSKGSPGSAGTFKQDVKAVTF